MRQRVSRGQRRQRQRRANGLLQPPGIAQGPDQPVVRFNDCGAGIFWLFRNRCAKSLRGIARTAGSEQIDSALAKRLGIRTIGLSHGFL
jgi:hypothetical protein